MNNPVGDQYQQETKYIRDKIPTNKLDWSTKQDIYKHYPKAKKIDLPSKEPRKTLILDEAIRSRKSIRRFSNEPISLTDLSYLLWACSGTERFERNFQFRTVPSAGGLYPIETYIVVNNVTKLNSGLYHYDIENHLLEELSVGDFGERTAEAALGQKMCLKAAVTFIWTAIFQRSKWKYLQRAYRYIYLDAGHIGAHISLSAVSLGLGSCQIAAFYDDEVNEIVGVDGIQESTVYMSVVGKPVKID